ncbi:MAG: four-helix bundle copper-binding protein [Sphingomonas sp.]|nr:four-helix bundle copper-binding protein [Sphingomonas sp.]
MSIAEMIKSHPDVAGHLNEPLAKAVRHAMFCSAICTSCADACIAEEMDMRQCIRNCLDCADICTATFTVAARRTASNEALIQAMLKLCIQACEICAAECEKHDNDHCRRCTEMCRECAADCKAALETF